MGRGSNSEMVKIQAVARFLRKPPEEVKRMIKEDALPHSRVPGKNKISFRIFLPDFHEWLERKSRTAPSPRLKDYEEFKRAFFEAQRT